MSSGGFPSLVPLMTLKLCWSEKIPLKWGWRFHLCIPQRSSYRVPISSCHSKSLGDLCARVAGRKGFAGDNNLTGYWKAGGKTLVILGMEGWLGVLTLCQVSVWWWPNFLRGKVRLGKSQRRWEIQSHDTETFNRVTGSDESSESFIAEVLSEKTYLSDWLDQIHHFSSLK